MDSASQKHGDAVPGRLRGHIDRSQRIDGSVHHTVDLLKQFAENDGDQKPQKQFRNIPFCQIFCHAFSFCCSEFWLCDSYRKETMHHTTMTITAAVRTISQSGTGKPFANLTETD